MASKATPPTTPPPALEERQIPVEPGHLQAIQVITHLLRDNFRGYWNLQKALIDQLDELQWNKRAGKWVSFRVNLPKCGIDTVKCIMPQGGVRCLVLTKNANPTWTKSLTGGTWRIEGKTLFGHMGPQLVKITDENPEVIIDLKYTPKVATMFEKAKRPTKEVELNTGNWSITNITFPPPKSAVTFGSNKRAVDFVHLIGSQVNHPLTNNKFFIPSAQGDARAVSVRSGSGMDSLVKNYVFKENGSFIRLGDLAIKIAQERIMSLSEIRLEEILDFDVKEVRRSDKLNKDHYPFLKYDTPADIFIKRFLHQPRQGPINQEGFILKLDKSWTNNPDIWEDILGDIAKVCENTW